ncbi:MAG TPA: transcription termination/antitermination protein NusG [Herpetosiphonaceae bacterium]|nr:transcription termination/antitermination protein NusG [Herpetosiphonaceae bacterium]
MADQNNQLATTGAATDEARWFVIHTYSGYENKVRQNLLHRIDSMEMKDQIFRVIVPTEQEIEIKNGQRRTVEKKVFPGYVLVQMVLSDDSWYVVRNTPGVTGFVGLGTRPTPLEDAEVKSILKQMESTEGPKVNVNYQVGQAVKISDGPFTDFEGVVDAIDQEKGKVRVLVSFFGRETPVELDFLQVIRLVD